MELDSKWRRINSFSLGSSLIFFQRIEAILGNRSGYLDDHVHNLNQFECAFSVSLNSFSSDTINRGNNATDTNITQISVETLLFIKFRKLTVMAVLNASTYGSELLVGILFNFSYEQADSHFCP